MRSLVQAGVRHPVVIETAQDLVRELPARRPDLDLAAVFDAVQAWLRYTLDPQGPLDSVELIKAPWVALDEIARTGRFVGDCDDATVLLAALLGAIGYPTQFRLYAADRARPGEPSHVAAAAWDGRRWVPLDAIVPTFRAGDEVPPRALTAPIARHPVGPAGIGCATGCRCARTGGDPVRARALGYVPPPVLRDEDVPPFMVQDRNTGHLEWDWKKLGLTAGAIATAVWMWRRRRRRR